MIRVLTFRSVDNPQRCGVLIEVNEDQVQDHRGDGERSIRLTEDEASDLLAWLRRWEGES